MSLVVIGSVVEYWNHFVTRIHSFKGGNQLLSDPLHEVVTVHVVMIPKLKVDISLFMME